MCVCGWRSVCLEVRVDGDDGPGGANNDSSDGFDIRLQVQTRFTVRSGLAEAINEWFWSDSRCAFVLR